MRRLEYTQESNNSVLSSRAQKTLTLPGLHDSVTVRRDERGHSLH